MIRIYRSKLKKREFGKEAPHNFDLERATIAGRQGASENRNYEAKPTQPKTDSSAYFGIRVIGWLSFCTSFLCATPMDKNREIAIRAAQEMLGNEACPTVTDKFQFLDELSLRPGSPDTFHVVDVGVLADRVSLWQKHLPNVAPHYAVKANNDLVISQVLAKLGLGFDCASEHEIEQILSLGVDPAKIVFANPRKSNAAIQYAKQRGVDCFTFDSLEELEKILKIDPKAKLLLRIKTDDSHSVIPLSLKFGATLEESYEILDSETAQKAEIIGIAFHVGSNCTHIESYEQAILDAASLFRYRPAMSVLDLGGGWPGTEDECFIAIAKRVNALVEKEFPSTTQVIAEPGRYFAAKTTTLAMKAIGKKRLKPSNKIAYYLSNGVFGFFMSSLYYDYNPEKILSEGWQIRPLRPNAKALVPSLLWGPTCDSGDKILDDILLPELETGDFLMIDNLGAYTKSLETAFNGIAPSVAYYLCEVKNSASCD